MFHPTQNRSFERCLSQPISWLSSQKQNQTLYYKFTAQSAGERILKINIWQIYEKWYSGSIFDSQYSRKVSY